jgi:hypothetical protein
MLQMFYLDVLKVDLGKHVLLLLMRRYGSPCAPARAAATACMRTHEMERAQDGPRGLRSRMGADTRELDVLDMGAGASSDANTLDQMFKTLASPRVYILKLPYLATRAAITATAILALCFVA